MLHSCKNLKKNVSVHLCNFTSHYIKHFRIFCPHLSLFLMSNVFKDPFSKSICHIHFNMSIKKIMKIHNSPRTRNAFGESVSVNIKLLFSHVINMVRLHYIDAFNFLSHFIFFDLTN